MYQHAYEVHPYKTITIGHLDDVASITRDDLMDFQRHYYVPENAFAVVVGQFNTPELIRLMETHFGCIEPGQAINRNYPVEPEQTEEKRFELDMPVQRSMLWIGYHAPAASHPDSLKLQVLATILARGGSSPFGLLSQGEDPVAMQRRHGAVPCWSRGCS